MNNNIKFSRVILNIFSGVFYVLLASIIFSFVFPIILNLLGQPILNPSDPVFDKIQIAIIVIVLVFSIIFRKFFYLPIRNGDLLDEKENPKKELELEHDMNVIKEEKIKETKKVEKKISEKEEESIKDDELDIKIGREVK